MILIAVPFNSNDGKMVNGCDAPRIFLGPHLLILRKVPFLIEEGTLKRTLHAFAEKGCGPDPQDSPSCAPESMASLSTLFCTNMKDTNFDLESRNLTVSESSQIQRPSLATVSSMWATQNTQCKRCSIFWAYLI